LQSENDREVWEKTKGSLWQDKGLISFSERSSNPLLWAHYAENHKGLCLGFDVSGASQVRYVSARRKMPSLLDIVKQKDTGIIENAIMTKYWHWRYESEWRIILSVDEVDNSGMSFLDFNENLILREVLVGYRSSLELKDFRKLAGPDIEIKRMRPAFNSFRVVTATRLVKKQA
jgi:hypothetical protein